MATQLRNRTRKEVAFCKGVGMDTIECYSQEGKKGVGNQLRGSGHHVNRFMGFD